MTAKTAVLLSALHLVGIKIRDEAFKIGLFVILFADEFVIGPIFRELHKLAKFSVCELVKIHTDGKGEPCLLVLVGHIVFFSHAPIIARSKCFTNCFKARSESFTNRLSEVSHDVVSR